MQEPTIPEMVGNFRKAMTDWVAKGFPVVKEDTFNERLGLCRMCKYWDESARLGTGKCRHRDCGCTKAKLWLGNMECPLDPPRWRKETE